MDTIERLLKANGFHLLRERKHRVYARGGMRFTMPSTPSCHRAELNQISYLKRTLRNAGLAFVDPRKNPSKIGPIK